MKARVALAVVASSDLCYGLSLENFGHFSKGQRVRETFNKSCIAHQPFMTTGPPRCSLRRGWQVRRDRPLRNQTSLAGSGRRAPNAYYS